MRSMPRTDRPRERRSSNRMAIADRGIVFASAFRDRCYELACYVRRGRVPRKRWRLACKLSALFGGFPDRAQRSPGDTNPIAVAFSASAITSGTWVLTVPSGHGFVVGQRVHTTGDGERGGSARSSRCHRDDRDFRSVLAPMVRTARARSIPRPGWRCSCMARGRSTLRFDRSIASGAWRRPHARYESRRSAMPRAWRAQGRFAVRSVAFHSGACKVLAHAA